MRTLKMQIIELLERTTGISKADPTLCTEINLFQAAVIPASFGEYVVESDGEGANTVTLVRWKKG